MSSAVYIKLHKPVTLPEWEEFCNANNIEYSPHTVGCNIFYNGDIEIHFGEPNFDSEYPRKQNGQIDFAKIKPPSEASNIQVSTYWMGNLEGVANIAKLIRNQWRCRCESDLELRSLMVKGRKKD